MTQTLRTIVLPASQRRTLEELTADLDLRAGDVRSKQTAFWTMLLLSGIIATAGVLSDSTATVIGAMIIAPLSTPIMAIALAIAKRQRNGATLFVVSGGLLVVLLGVVFAQVLPKGYDLLANSQISSRTSPGLLDLVAAVATGLAGSVALARRDVAAVLPGVAIAISLVPPLAVVGVCLGSGDLGLAGGAFLLFASNFLAMVLAGTFVFTVLGYASDAMARGDRSRRRAYTVLTGLMTLVLLLLVANTAATFALSSYTSTVREQATEWIQQVPGGEVTDVRNHGLTITVTVRAPGDLPPTSELLARLNGRVPGILGLRVESTRGDDVVVRDAGSLLP